MASDAPRIRETKIDWAPRVVVDNDANSLIFNQIERIHHHVTLTVHIAMVSQIDSTIYIPMNKNSEQIVNTLSRKIWNKLLSEDIAVRASYK